MLRRHAAMRTSITFAASVMFASQVALANGGGSDDWEGDGFEPPPPFSMTASIGGVRPAQSGSAQTNSTRIVSLGDGAAALVIDSDSGMLIRTDAKGANASQLSIGREAGLLAYDTTNQRAYVADRRGDRIVIVHAGDKLAISGGWRTPAEPYGVALSPDRTTLLVTTIADRTLVAFDTASGREKWRTALSSEPRGIAISPDGKRAVIATLTSGAVDQVDLVEPTGARKLALPAADDQHARGAFTVAFLGDNVVVPFQVETPVAKFPSGGNYGGGFGPPIAHQIAWLAPNGRRGIGVTSVHEPRALAWDGQRDRLYVAGLGRDELVAIDKASQIDVQAGVAHKLGARCGADGIALAPSGVLVWCSFTRSIARFDVTKQKLAKVVRGPELVASSLDAQRHEGFVLFHTANEHISAFGGLSCGSCHLDGRADGTSWRIKDKQLQTPMLAGRLVDTGPFKWDGTASDLQKSLRETVGRLGGSGLAKRHIESLASYLEGLPPVRTPTRNPAAVARGKQLFESGELGCATCHDGRMYTDRERHELSGAFETPSLVGLAASAPYFHDGSAIDLETALRDRGKVHGMADAATTLSAKELADLIAFLETL